MSTGPAESSIAELSETTSAEINFEDLIKVSNVTPQTTKDDVDKCTISTIASAVAVTNSITTSTATVGSKVVQKLGPPITTTKNGGSGQVVIIQGPSGTSVPIRIAASGTINNQNNQNKQVTIQVLKMPDGSFVQIKNNKSLNLTNLSNVAHVNIGAKKIASGQNQPIVIKTASTSNVAGTTLSKVTSTNSSLGAQILKSVSSVDNLKLSVSKSKVMESVKQNQRNISDVNTSVNQNNSVGSTATSTDNTSSNNTVTTVAATTTNLTSKQVATKILSTEGKDILIKTEGDGGTKQILVPHHVLKLSPTSSGPIQAIQIPGKSGVQYVKVLGTTASSNPAMGKILNTVSSKDTISVNSSAIAQISAGQKIILNTKARQNSSPITLNKDALSVSHFSPPPLKQQKSLITTIPTLKKITEKEKTLTLIKQNDNSKPNLIQHQSQGKSKISELNQQLNNLASKNNSRNANDQKITYNKGPQLLMISKELLKKVQVSGKNDDSNVDVNATKISDITSSKKLFSVLKPSLQDSSDANATVVENNISFSSSNRKRSASPSEGPRRKHCNCTKSQCLKLYCDCFANGEFCQDCNCKECFNNLENETERQKAIKMCLERNPNAFKPKITKARDQSDLRLHNKGCNCKRSGCLKNYCECYEAKIACSSNCKCLGCRNVEDRSEIDQAELSKISQNLGRGIAIKRNFDEIEAIPSMSDEPINKQAYNFITEDVVDATVQCMFAQTEECKKSEIGEKNSERMIIEELGRCLVEIIDFSIRNMDN